MSTTAPLKAPFPYFGGKATIAPTIWEALGDVTNYVEPFFGSGAVLLNRPHAPGIETVNDKDGFICNFWRAVAQEPETVAQYADWPSNENDLHARHAWLVGQRASLTALLEGDPDYYDAKIAGWWCWGLCCWIGSGWCTGTGPWQVVDGKLLHLGDAGQGVHRQRIHLGNAGQGVYRKRIHLGNAGQGVYRKRIHLGNAGQGVYRKRIHLGGVGVGVGTQAKAGWDEGLYAWMHALCNRLRRVRVTCGDWSRVCGPSITFGHGLTGVVLDPPYSHSERDSGLYAVEADIAPAIQAWCLAQGDNPLMRIVLCGYEGEYALPGWRVVAWKTQGGFSNQRKNGDNENKHRERLWLSPHCVETQLPLFRSTP